MLLAPKLSQTKLNLLNVPTKTCNQVKPAPIANEFDVFLNPNNSP